MFQEPSTDSPNWLYFRRFLAQPSRVASIFASSPALGRLVAKHIRRGDDEYVMELGAGTGAITAAILASGIPAERLVAVEIDPELAGFLQSAHPEITVIEGPALEIADALPRAARGSVGTVVCGLPVGAFSLAEQRRLVDLSRSLLRPGGRLLVYTHRLGSPLPAKRLGLTGKRVAFTLQNPPPASVWAYERDGARS